MTDAEDEEQMPDDAEARVDDPIMVDHGG